MNSELDLRSTVAADLEHLAASEAVSTTGERSTARHYQGPFGFTADRVILQRNVLETYWEAQQDIATEGKAGILTAGPPGAGKSTILREHELSGYRRLDADNIKDLLLQQAIIDGIYHDLLTTRLSDGHMLMPRELAALVHTESVVIWDLAVARSLANQENVVIEGTMTWPGLAQKLIARLLDHEYSHINIIDVEVTLAQAQENALHRWWTARTATLHQTADDQLGGRFTPDAAIQRSFPDATGGELSVCATNTQSAFESEAATWVPEIEWCLYDNRAGTSTVTRRRRVYGEEQHPPGRHSQRLPSSDETAVPGS